MLTLILAEAELELVPERIKAHPAVRLPAKARGRRPVRSLLDSSVHHDALRDISEGERRGRPDLVHFGLLLALDSFLNAAGNLRVLVHTRNDELIRVRADTRLMRHYPRFVGLMEQLFHNGRVPRGSDEPFLSIEEGWSLARVVAEEARGPVVVFAEQGREISMPTYLAERARASPDLTIVLGAFPKGDFHSDVNALAEEVVSLGPEAASVWTVESGILAYWEAAVGVHGDNPLLLVKE